MRQTLASLLFLTCINLIAQTNPEVYLCDIKSEYGGLITYNFQNISNDEGYDNQPSFASNNQVLFAGNKGGQTDIALYDISKKTKTWFHKTTKGGEYSPILIPGSKGKVSAVRLDPDGLQRLYVYDTISKENIELIEGLQVAYYDFYNAETIVASVLSDDKLDLVFSNFKAKKTDTFMRNVGRSIHRVPNSKTMSYASVNEDKNQEVYLLDMKTKESFFVCQLPIGIQDYTWLNDSQILIGSGSKLYIYDTFLNSDWKEVANLSAYNIKDITRLAVSPDGAILSLVAVPK
jgi:WD40 repeat protein